MKTSNNILIATLALLMISCLSETTFQSNFPNPSGFYVQPPTLEFFYKLDRVNDGVVYFENQSVSMNDFEWDFGVVETNGNRAKSIQKNPTFVYRANGHYTVKLSAVDASGVKHQIEKILDIDNCSN